MNWVKKHKLPAIKAIKYNGQPCIKLDNLWDTLHDSFNSTYSHKVDIQLLNEIPNKNIKTWLLFSRKELINAIEKCNNLSAPGPDKLSWSHIKKIIKNDKYIIKSIDIANTCIDLGHWPSHFKTSTTIVIPKPNKALYDSPRSFHPIILLNTMGKLFEKIIRERMQFLIISNNFIHPCQLGGLKHRPTMDARVALTHFIWSKWVLWLRLMCKAKDTLLYWVT